MKKILILFTIFCLSLPSLASGLMDLYSDVSAVKQISKKQVINTDNTNNTNNAQVQNTTSANSYNDIVNKGSKNYGSYANKNFRTNPIRINNPYNTLNDKKMNGNGNTATSYNGTAVKFKKGSDGLLYGYNKYGQKVGVYKVNSNGTTTQYNMNGEKTGVYK